MKLDAANVQVLGRDSLRTIWKVCGRIGTVPKLDSNLESPILLNRALPLRLGGGNNRIQNNVGVEESEAIYTMAERYELQSQSGKGKMPTVDRTPTGIP